MTNNLITGVAVPTGGESLQRELYAMLAYRLGRKESDIAGHLNLAAELYVDSLDLMEIEIGIAETFGVELTETELLSIRTVDDLQRIVVAALYA
ncbi:acyl carrier protein [Sodalis sp. C49]|uniref:acyl carrier protein n=1 Tax=unclassified Sodalis (in: enterobacteria) TaxID=2636512 RepID=UPI003965A7D2